MKPPSATGGSYMDYRNLVTDMKDQVLIVRLTWPEKRNAMSHQMRVDLMDCVLRAEDDEAVKAIIFTGDGDKSFCAGANIPELSGRTLASEIGSEATLRKELPTTIFQI